MSFDRPPDIRATELSRAPASKPYELVGAGPLTATVWKRGDERAGWRLRFNVKRQSHQTGAVSQLYRPQDVRSLVKLCQVLAAVFADDGCLPPQDRTALAELAQKLDSVNRAGG